MHLVGYLYEDYHDARSLVHKVSLYSDSIQTGRCWVRTPVREKELSIFRTLPDRP